MAAAATNKRLVFCFDGTWNRLAVDCPTNVVLMAEMIRPVARDGTPQVVFYDEGIGTDSWLSRYSGGIFGRGMVTIMREAYRFLIFNYAPGDEIFAFGFSRGAFTARSFIGFIRHAGILDAVNATKIDEALEIYRRAPTRTGAESPAGLDFRADYCRAVCVSEQDREHRRKTMGDAADAIPMLDFRYIGVWDTVRALGFPEFLPGARRFNRKHDFHDALLTSKVKAARHAVALDERRVTFRPTLFGQDKVDELNTLATARDGVSGYEDWQRPYQERWFPGVHGAVGGGGSRRGLSDGALDWILTGARKQGLDVRTGDEGLAYGIRPDPYVDLDNQSARTIWQRGLFLALRKLCRRDREGPDRSDELHRSTQLRWWADPGLVEGGLYRPGSLRRAAAAIAAWPFAREVKSQVDEYVVQRRDTLGSIAERQMGDRAHWRLIFEANRDRIDDPDFITVGMKLRIPPLGPTPPNPPIPPSPSPPSIH